MKVSIAAFGLRAGAPLRLGSDSLNPQTRGLPAVSHGLNPDDEEFCAFLLHRVLEASDAERILQRARDLLS